MKIKYFFFLAMVACIADFFTAMQVLGAEANPLYVITGSIWPIIIVKCLFLLFFFIWYKNPKTEHNYYYFCMAVVFSIVIFSFGAWTNIQGIMDPAIVTAGEAVAPAVKIQYYVEVISFIALIPLILLVGTFELFYRTREK